MQFLRRCLFLGAIIIIIILSNTYIYCHMNKELVELKNYNEVLRVVVNKQANTINDLEDEKSNLNSYVLQLEDEKIKLAQENNKPQQESKTVQANHSDFKSYMPYTAITSKASKQLKLQEQAYTDENGFRCIDGSPMVAVGTGWGLSVGDIALITCENGNSFKVVIGDIKDNSDTNSDNKTTSANNCRCEFIVDVDELSSIIRKSGNVAILDEYNGYVTNVEKIDSIKD